jgi:microcystin-dependent protein
MPSLLNPVITDAGLAAAIAASGAGLKLEITHIALGTGQYAPEPDQLSLMARKEQALVSSGSVGVDGSFHMIVMFPAWNGIPRLYNVSEIGFYAGDPAAGGILFAVYSHPTDVIVQRNSIDYLVSFGLKLSRVPAGSVTIVVDPNAAQSLGLVEAHERKPDPHPQYLTPLEASEQILIALEPYVEKSIVLPNNTNLDTVVVSGFYRINQLTNTGSQPVGFEYSQLIVSRGLDTITQMVTTYGQNRTFTRSGSPDSVGGQGVFTAWTELASTGFVLSSLGTGKIDMFPATTAPAGYIKANGALLSRASYPALYAYALASGNIVANDAAWSSGQFSPGDGSTTFRIPDVRGQHLRGFDDGRGVDAGRAIGSYQSDQLLVHGHGVTDPTHAHAVVQTAHSHGVTDPTHAHALNDPGHAHLIGASAGGGGGGGGDSNRDYGLGSTNSSTTGISISAAASGVSVNGATANVSVPYIATGVTVNNSAGGTETRVKNLALLACIKY